MFCNAWAFRDLTSNSTMTAANRDARQRGLDNPIFTGDSVIYDGIIYREIPEIAVISGVGASSIDVAPNYLCGAQAIGIAWAQRTKTVTDVRDYDFVIDLTQRIGEVFTFQDLDTAEIDFLGVRVPVVTPRTLIRMKRETGRPQDQLDVARLRERFGIEDL